MQTRLGSHVEAITNLGVGFSLNMLANIIFLPWLWNPAQPVSSAFHIGLVMTVVSYVRQFVLRRWFNRMKWGNKPA